MLKSAAIIKAKELRVKMDVVLQEMKDHKRVMKTIEADDGDEGIPDIGECIAQHTLSIRDIESAIMRQGMTLKTLGTPDPYPNSRDVSNTVVDPTADGMKM